MDRRIDAQQSSRVRSADLPLLTLASLVALAAALIWNGRLTSPLSGFSVFLLTTALAVAVAWHFVKTIGDDSCWDLRAIDTATLCLVVIVVIEMALGTLGLLRLPILMIALAGAGIGIAYIVRPSAPNRAPAIDWGIADVQWPHAVLAGLVILGITQLVIDRGMLPPVGDALGYHLPFVGEWLQAGRLTMPVPATGDPSPPFYPLNSSLWMFWTTAPFESDVLTRFVQTPFYVLLFLAVIRLGLEIHLPPSGALMAGLLTISQPDIIRGLALAENDLMLAGLLVAATASIATLWRRPTIWRALMSAALLGLALGTKTLAAPFVVLLGIAWLAVVVYHHHRFGWKHVATLAASAAGIALLLGGYSYVRNATVMGNPLYPVEIQAAGVELPGLYAATREWKESHPFYPFDWSAFFGFGMRTLFGWTIPILVLPGLLLNLLRTRRERRIEPFLLVLWCAASLAIFWYVIPYHFARFLYATLAWGIVAAIWGWLAVFRGRAAWLTLVAIPLATVNAFSIALDTDVWRNPPYLVAAVAITVSAAGSILLLQHIRLRLTRHVLALTTGAAILLTIVAWPIYGDRYESQRFEQWAQLGFLGSQPEAWQWLWEATDGDPGTIAVVDTNTTFPLYGLRLENRVLTLDPDGRMQAYDWNQPVRPQHKPDVEDWLSTIEERRVDYLWIMANADTGEWPIEDGWAAASGDFGSVQIKSDLHVWRIVGKQ